MYSRILELGKDTAVYGLSTIIGRLLNFLLVPFYANYLLPAENGIVANIYAYIAFVFVFYTYGMEHAYMRFVVSPEYSEKCETFSVAFFSLSLTSLLFSGVLAFNASFITSLIGIATEYEIVVYYVAGILLFDTLSVVPFASLRMERKAIIFAVLKIVNITVTLLLNILFVVQFDMRVDGVFLANLIASALTFLLMLWRIRELLQFRLSKKLYKEMLKFGIPYVPSGIATMAMQVIDRPIVKALTDDATLGVYQLNYRLGIFMMLVVGMYDYAWRPFFLSYAKEQNAPQLFARVFTYFTFLMMVIFIGVSLFIEDLVRFPLFGRQFFPSGYWNGTQIVPIVLIAYMFAGAYSNFIVGIYLEKKTIYVPLVTSAGAVINVIANLFLIPRFGILGAALATLISYVAMASGMYIVSQKMYFVPYEWRRVTMIFIVGLILYSISRFFFLMSGEE